MLSLYPIITAVHNDGLRISLLVLVAAQGLLALGNSVNSFCGAKDEKSSQSRGVFLAWFSDVPFLACS
jgi:hypothetical protein